MRARIREKQVLFFVGLILECLLGKFAFRNVFHALVLKSVGNKTSRYGVLIQFSMFLICLKEEVWAIHGGTAIPGQPVPAVKQASDRRAGSKNQFNKRASLDAYQILS